MINRLKLDTFLTTGVILIFVYGIWSTRWAVHQMYYEGSVVSKQNAACIDELKLGQQAIIETLGIVKTNNLLAEENYRLLKKLAEQDKKE
jgi:hypothetical protein